MFRAESVVQIAAQPPALLLPGHDQPLPRPPQRPIEQNGVSDNGHLAAEVTQQAALGRREVVAGVPPGDHQPADLAAAVSKHDDHRLGVDQRAVDGGGTRRLVAT